MNYSKGDYYLIEDKKYKAKKYIGEIIEVKKINLCLLNIYIFPEDTINGRQPYMSQFEVFLTGSQSLYQFTGIKEQQVRVMKIEEYILRKYEINEKMAYPLYYYYRQTYSIEKDIFYPEILPSICYCQEIFNPDIPFKKCICGNIFHPDCLLQTNSGKCLSKICNYNCNNLLSDEEQIKKIKLLYGDTQKEIKNITKDTDVDDFKNDFLNKKTHRPKNNGDKKLLYIINKEESNNPEKEKDKTEIIKDEDNTDIPRK